MKKFALIKGWGLLWYLLITAIYLSHSPTYAHSINTTTLQIQQQPITGTVTDATNVPIAGVNVTVKNRAVGTITNFSGEYTLNVQPNDTLVFSYMGYNTVTKPVNGRTTINIQIQKNANALKEVVINAGYYNTTKKESTGNISKITAKEIQRQPVNNPLEALQGRMAGVVVVQQSGIPGAAPKIQIRGQNSLRNSYSDNGNRPLYIVNGVPINSNPIWSINKFIDNLGVDPLNTISLANIKSIEVLKDADATAIYGSRGANGVILITTKNGKGQKGTKVAASFYSGISRVSHFVEMLHTDEYLRLRRQAFQNDGVKPTKVNAFDLLLWDQNRYTNWQKKLFGGTAHLSHINLSISGGNEQTHFLIGASHQKQGSVFPGDFSYRKQTLNANINHSSKNHKFSINLSVNYGLDNNELFSDGNFMSSAFRLPPNAPKPYNLDGSLNWEASTWNNPFSALESEGTATVHNLLANMGINYRFSKKLNLKINLGYTRLDSKQDIRTPISTYDPVLWERVSNRSHHARINRRSFIAEPQLNYNNVWDNHHLNALIGGTVQENVNTSLRFIGTGYSDKHLIGNLAAADEVSVGQNRELHYRYSAVYARLGYNWKRRYFLNLTGRRDGSSRFGPGKRIANFGAVGVAWIFSREDLMSNKVPFLSFGKIRGSYGITGNDQIGDYRYLDAYQATPGPNGLYPTQLTNPDFSWETNKKLEAALELGFFNDRFNINLIWYRNRSSNQLVGYPLPATTGFTSIEANLPATVQNTGWEFELSSTNIKGDHFVWETSANLSIPRNKLVAFPNIEKSSYSNTYRVGKPLNLAILYNFQGVDPETGLYTVEDVNSDGLFDYEDRILTRNLGREYFGGLYNRFTYKGVSVGFLLEFVKQKGYKFSATPPGRIGNSLKRQSPLSGRGNLQKPSQSIYALLAYNNYAYRSDFAITDASFIRLKTLSLGYDLPQKLLELTGLDNFHVFFRAQNLFTLTNYVGLDPQYPGAHTLPALQSITGGVQLKF